MSSGSTEPLSPGDIASKSEPSVASADLPSLHVVGIGASAGGLEALERLFRSMPVKSGMAFVVIQHLSPDFRSLMDELLARHTSMPIHRVEDGMTVEPDSIYLIPPRKEMIISGGKLLLTDKDPDQDLSLPIDHFFRSLAQDSGRCSIAVVLSGTGSDGSRGVRDVHEAGGLVIVQNDETAKFNGMPRSARETGVVDYVLSPEEIPDVLLEHTNNQCDTTPRQLSKTDLRGVDVIFKALRDEYGIDFSFYKPNTVGRRIERRQYLTHSSDLEQYVELVRTDPAELSALYHDLLIGVTRFFRDREAFDLLERQVIPELLLRKQNDEEIRVWCAGCATGEEAYSLAILIHERLTALGRPVNVKIFATDVHRASLEVASAGRYSRDVLGDISPARLDRYFVQKPDGFHVANDLRQMVVFAVHNLIKDAPFTKLDLISCRNLLIYLQPPIQKKVLSLFHFGLKTGGVLFLGPSESTGELGSEFEEIDQHWKLSRKRRDIRLPPDMRMPVSASPAPVRMVHPPATSSFDPALLNAYDRLLDKYMPPGMLVTERRTLVHAFGNAARYMTVRPGRASTDILDLLVDDLKLPLAGALQRAAKDVTPVVYSSVRVSTTEGEERLTLRVEPVLNRHGNLTHLFISFESDGPRTVPAEPQVIEADEASRELVSSLQAELHYTRENLQATVEELETSNEEMQATNEELVASNEELQSTNEELHSVNEELYTVNAEYQKKIVELTELTDDMDNLLRSTDVGVIFVDRSLSIRKFTPQIGRAFDLLPQDVGRRIDSFSYSLQFEGLVDALQRVLHSGVPFEKDVQDRHGSWFLLRILPYRSHSALAGVVLTLIDITSLKRAEEELRRTASELVVANQDLRETVVRRRQAEQEAREEVDRRDRFLAMLSHELRNPLAAILNAARLLDYEGADDEMRRLANGAITRQSQQMARLLDDLLDVSRITRNKIEIRRQVVDLRETSRDAVEAVRVQLDGRSHQLHLELPSDPIYVNGDPARLQQIQVNLLANAIKYTPRSGQIWLSVTREGDTAVVRVRDTGIGIPAAMREKVFDLFVQLDNTIGSTDGGMGVGLTLVRALVNLHGGSVSVASSESGDGSEFVVRLPVVTNLEAPSVRESPRSALDGLKVLLVEDNADIRATTLRLLQAYGCQAMAVEDGRRGVEAVSEHRPEVALIDIGMPGMNGYEAAQQIRQRNDGHSPLLIALTGFGQAEDRAKALAAGFNAHLVKPIDLQQLSSVLRQLRPKAL